jgi:hypothetical protein
MFDLMYLHDNKSDLIIWTFSIAFTISTVTFNVSHFELAWIYRKIANDSPKMLESLPVNEEFERRQKLIYRVLMVINVLVPSAGGVVYLLHEK